MDKDELDRIALKYLSLPPSYTPRPSSDPIPFLQSHLKTLPPSLLANFSPILGPRQRTSLTTIRNRRFQYYSTAPNEFRFPVARNKWVELWDQVNPSGVLQENWREEAQSKGQEEKRWAEKDFLGGRNVVGEKKRLGQLLGGYEEERVGEEERDKRRERLRNTRTAQEVEKRVEEQERHLGDEEDEEEEEELQGDIADVNINPEILKITFERLLKEKFIDGLLENFDYDRIDWDDRWDVQSRDDEDRWFDEDDEDE